MLLFFTLFNAFADNKKYGIINQNNMKLKTFIAMGLLSMFSLGSCNAQQKDDTAKKELHYTMNESAPKNYYLLTMSSNGCNFRILVNDIPVYGFWDEGTYSGSYPINHFIQKSGTQKLKVELYPAYTHEDLGINSEEPLYIEIKKRLDGQTLDDYVAVLTNPIPKVQKGIPYYEYECSFEAEVPYEITELDELVDLSQEPNIEQQVVAKYNELKDMYEKKRFSAFQKQFDTRNKRIWVTNYIPINKGEKDDNEDIERMKKFYKHVAPIQNYEMRFFGDKKLVMLFSKEDCTYAFRLYDGGSKMWAIPFFLGMRKGSDKLEIVF
jgi:hypothetical protein